MLKGAGIIEDWIEEGVERGVAEGTRTVVLDQLREKFGELPESVVDRINSADARWCRRLGVRLLRAESLAELGL